MPAQSFIIAHFTTKLRKTAFNFRLERLFSTNPVLSWSKMLERKLQKLRILPVKLVVLVDVPTSLVQAVEVGWGERAESRSDGIFLLPLILPKNIIVVGNKFSPNRLSRGPKFDFISFKVYEMTRSNYPLILFPHRKWINQIKTRKIFPFFLSFLALSIAGVWSRAWVMVRIKVKMDEKRRKMTKKTNPRNQKSAEKST